MAGDAAPFPAGTSANAGGRPKKTPEMREAEQLARQRSPEAMRCLLHLMEHSEDDRVRVAAANSVLDRALGKPMQSITAEIEHRGDQESARALVREELLRMLRPLESRVVDSTAEQAALPAKGSEK